MRSARHADTTQNPFTIRRIYLLEDRRCAWTSTTATTDADYEQLLDRHLRLLAAGTPTV